MPNVQLCVQHDGCDAAIRTGLSAIAADTCLSHSYPQILFKNIVQIDISKLSYDIH